jgi:hypothetical protein
VRKILFGQIGGVVDTGVDDLERARLRMLVKGGKEKLVWLHHEAEQFLDAYLASARIEEAEAALFSTLDKTHRMSGTPLTRRDSPPGRALTDDLRLSVVAGQRPLCVYLLTPKRLNTESRATS